MSHQIIIQNVGRLDRMFRVFIGVALITYTTHGGAMMPGWQALLAIGAILVFTATISFCPLYRVLGFSSSDAC